MASLLILWPEMMAECTDLVSLVIKLGLGAAGTPFFGVFTCAQDATSAKVRSVPARPLSHSIFLPRAADLRAAAGWWTAIARRASARLIAASSARRRSI